MESLPSQQLVSIDQIKDGVIILKTGGLRRVLMTSGLNFELFSQEEREIAIRGFQQLLFSLDFSLQCAVHSRRVDISNYISHVKETVSREENELLRIQAEEYIRFISAFVELYGVMEKKFFVVVPYDPVRVSAAAIGGQLQSMITKKPLSSSVVSYSQEEFDRYKSQLETRVAQVTHGLTRIGVNAIPLETEDLIELLHSLYNPAATEKPFKEE